MSSLSKKVTSTTPASLYLDYQTLKKCKAFELYHAAAPAAPLVRRSHVAAIAGHAPYHCRRDKPEWIPSLRDCRVPLPLARTHNPAPWRDLTPFLRLVFFHKALWLSGTAYSVTLDLAHSLQAEVRDHGSNGWNYLRRRLDRFLVRSLGYRPGYWFVGEESEAGHLHLHGGIGATSQDRDALASTLRRAGGKVTPGFHRNHLYLPPSYDGDCWPLYCAKNLRPGAERHIGPTYTCSNSVGRIARSMYETERSAILNVTEMGRWPELERVAFEHQTKSSFIYSAEFEYDDAAAHEALIDIRDLDQRFPFTALDADPPRHLYGTW